MSTEPSTPQPEGDIDVSGHLTTALFTVIVVLMVLLIMAIAMAS